MTRVITAFQSVAGVAADRLAWLIGPVFERELRTASRRRWGSLHAIMGLLPAIAAGRCLSVDRSSLWQRIAPHRPSQERGTRATT
jgi:hypothetical protein